MPFCNTITKITLLNSKKTFILCGKDHPTSKAKAKEKMIKEQYSNYTILINSKLVS
jgi:hypothetical protein